MATLGAVMWDDGAGGAQPWTPAAHLCDTIRFGLALSGVDFYDDMDNYAGRDIRYAVGGGWYHSRFFTVKCSYSQFAALEMYREQALFVSLGTHAVRRLGLSVEGRATRVSLAGVADEEERMVELGASVWYARAYGGVSLCVDHLTLEDASTAGFAPDPVIRAALHTRRHRWGALGASAEVVLGSEPYVRFAAGEELWLYNRVGLCAGLSTEPFMVSMGVVVWLGRAGAAVAFVHHPELGWSKGVSAMVTRP